ncbi:MAG: type III pantothenate kinase [Muribaculaceae bacterium]|nr:type III pantothenate kinase [Muribaculaceae bacterium]
MSYYLTIDQGNSSAKIALFSNFDIVESRRVDALTMQEIDSLIDRRELTAAIYSSVAADGDDIVDALATRCKRVYRMSSDLLLTVEIGYDNPSSLGADRIAACAGAAALFPFNELLVVDAGTAVTYDYVNAQTSFVGGNIAPGLRMRLDALSSHTSRLPHVDVVGPEPEWGTDTDTAMRLGAIQGVVGEIEHYAAKISSSNKKIILTGGDAEIISRHLPIAHEVVPNLVDIGLNSILLFNEY